MVEVRPRFGAVVQKPEIIANYNKYMGGIDHQDQMLAYYSCERKCLRWYKKLECSRHLNSQYQLCMSCNLVRENGALKGKSYGAVVSFAGPKIKQEKTLGIIVQIAQTNQVFAR
uniref:SFRICE_040132 n=1 Tax=Spodoptera frugiperda TaxID=7108 RepID=A0A2H1WKI8_SPOFR